jgi:hypothetical protein
VKADRNYGGTCVGIQIGYLTSRSLNWQRQTKPRDRASEGQPENLVGRFWLFDTDLNRTNALGDLTGPIASRLAPTVSTRFIQIEIGRLSGRHRWQARLPQGLWASAMDQ